MNTKIIGTLVKKELLDVLRDKKTVIMMLVVPVILYPLIFIGVMQIGSMIASNMEEREYRIAVDAEDGGAFADALAERSRAAGEDGTDTGSAPEDETADTDEDGPAYTLTLVDADSIGDYQTALENEEIDAYVRGGMRNDEMRYDVYYISSVADSANAADIVMDVFDGYREELTEIKIKEAGLDAHEILEPIDYVRQDTATSEQSLGSIMGMILPFMLVISLLMGTMYPAIDTTAGERERGTLETILTLPVTNRQLIVSKFITVAMIGMISAFFNILSMGGIAFYMYRVMELQSETAAGFDMAGFYPAIIVGVLAVFVFSLFVSAITMCVTAFAKSYKEANNYITPLMLVVMFTGYIGFIPNVELTQVMAMVPVANICLLIKNLLAFKTDYTAIAEVLVSNVAYAVLAVLFLSRIYDSEAVLFGDTKSGFQLFEKRSNLPKGGVPTVSDAWFVAAVTIVLVLYAGSLMQLRFGLGGVFGTQMIILLVPLAVALYTKKDLRRTYGFRAAPPSASAGALILILGLYLVNIVLSDALIRLFPSSADSVELTFSSLTEGSPVFVFLVLAAAPAVCEEMLFRGFILHAMRARYRAPVAVGVVTVLFGLYHMSLIKFLPTGLLGLALCCVVYKTGSIYLSMMMHFINNAVSVAAMVYSEALEKAFPFLYRETLPVREGALLGAAGVLLALTGAAVLSKTKPPVE